jgi:hypothetical protein
MAKRKGRTKEVSELSRKLCLGATSEHWKEALEGKTTLEQKENASLRKVVRYLVLRDEGVHL